MGIAETLKDEISSNILAQNKDTLSWDQFIEDMKDTIISHYNGEEHIIYKRQWKHAFRTIANELKRNLTISHQDNWAEVLKDLPEPSSGFSSSPKSGSSTSSLQYQKKLNLVDYKKFEEIHQKISNKWVLKSGTVVEDTIYNVSKKFNYEHPAHSFIFNPNDPIWIESFSLEDLKEVKESLNISLNKKLPDELHDIIMLLDKKTSFRAIYDAIEIVKADPVESEEKYWLKCSIINYNMLFKKGPTLKNFKSEEDLLDEVYGFIKLSREVSTTETEKKTESTAASEVINSNRLIGAVEKINRKMSADHADLVFKYLTHELACVEIGLVNKGKKGTKEMQELEIKTPLMLKGFILRLTNDYEIMPKGFKLIAYVISGMYISTQVMTCNKGSVALVRTSKRYHMPETPAEIPKLLPPLLKLAYNCAMVIKDTVNHLKEVSSSVSSEEQDLCYPPCFVASDVKRTYHAAFSD